MGSCSWKQQGGKLLELLPVRTPSSSSASHAVFHEVPVRTVGRLTDNSVAITFDVPAQLHEQFQFTAGQHLTVATDLGPQGVRRNYSICSPATGGRIAVKHIPGGAFSTFALEQLRAGDTLELMTSTGRRDDARSAGAQELCGDRGRERDHPAPVERDVRAGTRAHLWASSRRAAAGRLVAVAVAFRSATFRRPYGTA